MHDIEVTLAMTLVLVQRSRAVQSMGVVEKALVSLLYAYCAHCLVFDEFIPFKVWHEWVFSSYCGLGMLNVALRKVCMLARWRFHVRPEEFGPVLERLHMCGCSARTESMDPVSPQATLSEPADL